MSTQTRVAARPQNRLLSLLPSDEYNNLRPYLKDVSFRQGEVLHYSDIPATDVYFLNRGVASLSVSNADGLSLGLSIVGNEAVIGERVIFKRGHFITQCQMISDGCGYKLDSQIFQREFYKSGVLNDLVLSQLDAKMTETYQTALCNYAHLIEQRFSRWLLTYADRAQSEKIYLTQELISSLLGVHRPSISVVAATLQAQRLISYKRGMIKIIDREGLDDQTCECYQVIKGTVVNSSQMIAPEKLAGKIRAEWQLSVQT